MLVSYRILVGVSLFLLGILLYGQENAAPSIHISCFFPSEDAILKMSKIKIEESADASYFEVNWFKRGYTGLQQSPNNTIGSYLLISSLWDIDTAQEIYSEVNYTHPNTQKSRFGGEGNGWKTLHPYPWELHTWYNFVNRAWKAHGRLYNATFICNESTGEWLHTATLSIPFNQHYLYAGNNAFLENWDGTNPSWDGRYKRKAFLKDVFILTLDGRWEKNNIAHFSANKGEVDIKRNGIYHNAFNAYFDTKENAYCMEHGGNAQPSETLKSERSLYLPLQSNQADQPKLTLGKITSSQVLYNQDTLRVSWQISDFHSPQFSSKIDILDASHTVIKSIEDTLPQRRNYAIPVHLPKGKYKANIYLKDIFNQNFKVKKQKFRVGK